MKAKLYLICLLLASCQSNEIELNNIIQQKRTSDSELAKGNIFPLSKEYKDNNNNSIVIRLTYGNTTFLMTGDAEEEAEEDMLSSGLPLSADVLKLGHHGSSSSTSDDFLSAVDPTWAVISCAEGNKYGHPHAETMNKLRAAGISVFRTDEQGTITATTDGTTITWNASPSETWQTGEGRSSE